MTVSRDAAWAVWAFKAHIPTEVINAPEHNMARLDFNAGWDARDAEVADLTRRLAATELINKITQQEFRSIGEVRAEARLLRSERDAALELVEALRAEKDSPHADAKYWRELQQARAEIAEASAGWAANGVLVGEARAERDDALKRVAALMSHLEHWDAEHDRAVIATHTQTIMDAQKDAIVASLADNRMLGGADALEEFARIVMGPSAELRDSATCRMIARDARTLAAEYRKPTPTLAEQHTTALADQNTRYRDNPIQDDAGEADHE